MQEIYVSHYQSPYVTLEIRATHKNLLSLSAEITSQKDRNESNTIIGETIRQLDDYFNGKRKTFRLPLIFTGYTLFQRAVWQALAVIPFGEMSTYREIASVIGKKSSVRAVGNACGKNPYLLIIPCHRVIRSDGKPGGFTAGTGLKQQLLEFEARYLKKV